MEERRNEILKELDRKGRVKVTDLSKEFGCSEVTIRNDIKRRNGSIRQRRSTGMLHRRSGSQL